MASLGDEEPITAQEESTGEPSEFTSTGEFSITNPFESQHTIDSLLQPSFSPSVFSKNSSSQAESEKSQSSFWTIDQIAVLKPAEIDVSGLHNQQEFVRLDPASERRAQQAIDEFFANRAELQSPWSDDRSQNHYLALISPSPAQMKKRPALATPGSSVTSTMSTASQIRVRKLQLSSKTHAGDSSTKSKIYGKIYPERRGIDIETKNVSTQTTLTLPKDFDLEAVLSQYYTFGLISDNPSEAPSNTSLRRKLFFPDGREVEPRDRHGEINVNALQHIDDIQDLEKFIDSPVPLKKIDPDDNNMTPLTHTGHSDMPRTPSTCQSHFSSSPVQSCGPFDPTTPCSSDFRRQRFGSGVRPRKMLGSSEDEELIKLRMETVTSPELSPVKREVFCDVKDPVQLCETEPSGAVDESMSFRVCDDDNSYKMVPESSGNAAKKMPTLESSRRQLPLESPPFSPIEPTKSESNDKISSSCYTVNSSEQSLLVSGKLHALCPSPMLSPICGKHLRNSSQQSESAGHLKPMSSLLSSTVTRGVSSNSRSDFSNSAKDCCLDLKQQSSELRPFQSYESRAQFSGNVEENKENLCPAAVGAAVAANLSQDDDDVSMSSCHTSFYEGYMCNDDERDMQVEKRILPTQHGKDYDKTTIDDNKPPFQLMQVHEDVDSLMPAGPDAVFPQENPKKLCWRNVTNIDLPGNRWSSTAGVQILPEPEGDSRYTTTQSHLH